MRFPPLARAVYAKMIPKQRSPTTYLDERNVIVVMHFAHEISITSGEILILDRTPEQFDWSDSIYSINKEEVVR